jgi:hypothetical protein
MPRQIEKPVEGIRKRAIGGKLHGVFRTQNHVQPRMLTSVEPACHRGRNQTVSGDRNKFSSFKPQ